ncbi:hypothetical protein AB0C52_05705 [Streptomyces sp. NPDC048717]|uniref:hypothetical protein n=1 Tax=Streptomyces sp. NPDC048717 TaxID=3154928 RepID=UPI003435F128
MEQLTIRRPAPDAGFVSTLLTSTWVDRATDGVPLVWLSLAYPDSGLSDWTTEIESRLLGLAESLGLALASKPLPDTGGRVILRAGTAALYYGHPTAVLRLPHTSRRWMSHVAHGGAVVLALGLDPIPPGADRDGIEEYLLRSGEADRLYMGMAGLRRAWA